MGKVVVPDVTVLATGTDFVAKQMRAGAGETMPSHHASMESVLFVYDGECILELGNREVVLRQGEATVIPKLVRHQIKAVTDYKGIHFMPKDIKFEFFKP